MICCRCKKTVTDGVLEGGKVRHVRCETPADDVRVTLLLPASAVALFKRLGGGNASRGARVLVDASRGLTDDEIAGRAGA